MADKNKMGERHTHTHTHAEGGREREREKGREVASLPHYLELNHVYL